MKVSEQELRKKAAGTGALLGLIVMVLSIFSFYFMTGIATSFWMVSFSPFIFSITIPLIITILFSIDLRKKIGGFWAFKQAVAGFFVMFAVCYVVNYVGVNLLFAKVIEPHMVEKTQEAVKNATAQMLEKQGADQEKIDEAQEKIQKKFDEQKENSPTKIIAGIGISLIFIFIVALIFAAIFKKDPPLYTATDYQEPDATV